LTQEGATKKFGFRGVKFRKGGDGRAGKSGQTSRRKEIKLSEKKDIKEGGKKGRELRGKQETVGMEKGRRSSKKSEAGTATPGTGGTKN